jgi:hypothetical protein
MQMTASSRTPSITFFVDETRDELIAYEKKMSMGAASSKEEILRMPLDEVRSRTPSNMQRTVGRLVLSFLNSRSTSGLNLPRDAEDDKALDQDHLAQLRVAAQSQKPQALYDLAISLIAHGMQSDQWSDIEQGERLLEQAVAANHPDAVKYHTETWALIRPRLVHRLKPEGAG